MPNISMLVMAMALGNPSSVAFPTPGMLDNVALMRNGGSPGIDGMTVEKLPGYLKEHWPRIRESLLRGDYKPSAVKRVEIPKPGGGLRLLGIPMVLDPKNAIDIGMPVKPQPTRHYQNFRDQSKLASRTALRLRGMLGSAVVALNHHLGKGDAAPPFESPV